MLLLLPATAAAWSWSGKVVRVIDGDRNRLLHEGRQEQIRLWRIDCPEMHQDFGTKAKQATTILVFASARAGAGRACASVVSSGAAITHAAAPRGPRSRGRQGCAAISLQGQAGGARPKLAARPGVDARQLVLAADPP